MKEGVLMLTPEKAKLLEDRVMADIADVIPENEKLAKAFASIATKISIITLQEYEKLSENQEK